MKSLALSLAALAAVSAQANMIVNPGLELGNVGFSSDYTYVAPAPNSMTPPSVYTVAGNSAAVHDSWASVGAYEGSQYLIINGATSTGEKVWKQSVALTGGQEYTFSYAGVSVFAQSPAVLNLTLDSTFIAPTVTFPGTTGQWNVYSFSITPATTGVYELSLTNSNTAFSGNDFGLDAFNLAPVPEPASMAVLGLGLAALKRRRAKK